MSEYSQVGERLGIRPPARADCADWIEVRRASLELHRAWEPWPFPLPDRVLFAAQLEKTAYLLVRLDDRALVGQVNVNLIVRGPFQNCCLGYWIGAPYARRGYMSEGVSLVLRECFTRLRLHRVEANIIPTNEASLRVARRCGFRHEGFSPRFLQIAGRWQDHERFAMTREDWERRSSSGAHEPLALEP